MSKTFKSSIPDNRIFVVEEVFNRGPRLGIKEPDGSLTGFIFDKSDAPALMQAIGSVAGHQPAAYKPEEVSPGSDRFMRYISHLLAIHVRELDNRAAAARELAELEAEALELVNAHRTAVGSPTVASWDGFTSVTKSNWLAVARRAREIGGRAEK